MTAEAFLLLRPSDGGVCCPQTGLGAGAQRPELPPPHPCCGPGHMGRAALTSSLCSLDRGAGRTAQSLLTLSAWPAGI